MKWLFTITAAIECGAGLALVCCPSVLVMILIGVQLDGPAAGTVARVGGSGLLALTLACWLAREEAPSRAARGLVAGITVYNAFTATFLAYAGIGYQLQGPALWPAVLLHLIMTAWCVTTLRRSP